MALLILALNILVIYAHFKSGNLSKNGSPIFILSAWSLVVSSLLLLFIGLYVGPSITFMFIWPDVGSLQPFAHFVGQSMLGLVFCGSLFNCVIAINR